MTHQNAIRIACFLAGVLFGALAFGASPTEAAARSAFEIRSKYPLSDQPFIRFLWCANAGDEETGLIDEKKLHSQHVAAATGINFGPNISGTEWRLDFGGYPGTQQNVFGDLILVDGRTLANNEHDVLRQLQVWDSLQFQEAAFTTNVAVPVKDAKGKTTTQHKRQHVHAQAPPTLIYRLDWFLSRALTTLDGGAYYTFRGLEAGKTKQADYLKARGISQRATSKNRAGLIRHVNGKPGAIDLRYGNEIQPLAGLPLFAITQDIFDGRVDGAKDPFLSLLNIKFDGEEAFATTENGWVEFTLWDSKGFLVAEAPPNLVRDWTIPQPHTDRLAPSVSCLSCHGPQSLWHPYRNEVRDTLNGFARYFGEFRTKQSNFENQRLLAAQYSGEQSDIDRLLADARDSIDRRISASTGGTRAVESIAALVSLINHYEREPVDARLVCLECGIVPQVDEADPKTPAGVATLRKILPPLAADGSIAEGAAGLYARLLTTYPVAEIDEDGNPYTAYYGMTITRRQFENLEFDIRRRTAPHIAQATKGEAQ